MSSSNLLNLMKAGQIKAEQYNEQEYKNLIHFGQTRLEDAFKESLSQESRFLLAYNAAHSFALAALRKNGYRSNNRYIVFQVLPFTLEIDKESCRILDICHNRRNVAEYEGHLEIDEKLLKDLLNITQVLFKQLNINLLKEFGKDLTLNGLDWKKLRDEGRR